MVNYQCTAACRHCLYSCSPTRGKGYVNGQSAEKICSLLRKGGCSSVHIGGGEPFLDFEGLLMMIRKLRKTGITLEYIETNAFWAAPGFDIKEAEKKLITLLAEGKITLCISVDPFHAEYVPYGAPLALVNLCEKIGVGYFLWKQEFLPLLSCLDSQKAHSRAEMESILSDQYIGNTASLYGIGYGGRAVNIEREFAGDSAFNRKRGFRALYPMESFTADNSPCRNLLSTGHFHVDMNCFFIPPRCTGIHIPLSEAIEGLPEGMYPVFEALYLEGISGLIKFSLDNGFSPDKTGYPSKCNLCFHIRHFLAGSNFPELDRDHYEEALKYY